MIYIAHRGLVNGPDVNLENRPQQIEQSLQQGYHCEIDVWYKNSQWYLGHDGPDYKVDYEFLRKPNLWIHAKNLDALYVLGADPILNYFWHQDDDFTLTSKGYIWTYPGKELTKDSVMVMPEHVNPELQNLNFNCYAICSDWIEKIKELNV